MTAAAPTPGPFRVVQKAGLFPALVLIDRPGLRWSDGSGSDESLRNYCRLTINVGPDPEYLKRGIVVNTMKTCVANALLFASSHDLLKLARALVAARDHAESDRQMALACDALADNAAEIIRAMEAK